MKRHGASFDKLRTGRAWSMGKKLAADSLQQAASMLEVGGALRLRLEAKITGQRTDGSNY